MIVIIDGYNLLFHDSWPYHEGALEDRRKKLIDLVVSFKQKKRIARVIVVFDGCAGIGPYKKQTSQQGIEIIYAICQGKADEKIISLSKHLNNVMVVTADRRIIKYTKRNRSSITSPQSFTQELLKTQRRTTPKQMSLPTNDVDEWLEEFGLDDEVEIPKNFDEKLPQVPEYTEEQTQEEDDALLDEESVEDWMKWFRFKEGDYE
ncbi:NYN domain-containing protein [Candidatus Uabimicrobium amorphum]|uniref:YacP-like NYN domain protein n=1 Tax=Uabimicrobium amorphum TaxID=2596890 RepID=A0A5S9IJW7_UABAM|nr:NYN domain-containing protein [Candidatus Uabimicrobium amorphum]BBM82887.1 hypothetical protein UABAM_01230 [Candidatus Uabimicrobium amorphum]